MNSVWLSLIWPFSSSCVYWLCNYENWSHFQCDLCYLLSCFFLAFIFRSYSFDYLEMPPVGWCVVSFTFQFGCSFCMFCTYVRIPLSVSSHIHVPQIIGMKCNNVKPQVYSRFKGYTFLSASGTSSVRAAEDLFFYTKLVLFWFNLKTNHMFRVRWVFTHC